MLGVAALGSAGVCVKRANGTVAGGAVELFGVSGADAGIPTDGAQAAKTIKPKPMSDTAENVVCIILIRILPAICSANEKAETLAHLCFFYCEISLRQNTKHGNDLPQ